MPCGGQVVDTGRVKYGQINFLPEKGHLLEKRCKRRGHSRHVIGQARERINPAGYQIQKIDDTVITKFFGDLNIILKRKPTLIMVVLAHGHPNANQKIISNCATNSVKHHSPKPHPVFKTTAVFILSMIGGRRPKLIN